jgi:hypothetical protein
MPARSFQVILNKALKDYHEQIGVDLNKHPFSNELRGRDSPDKVLKLLMLQWQRLGQSGTQRKKLILRE